MTQSVRAINDAGDWLFGAGRSNYVRNINAIAQNIDTRLNCVLGNCFYDLAAGIDWFNLLGAKDQTALKLAISTCILKTDGVTGLQEVSAVLDSNRNLTVKYTVITVYSIFTNTFTFDSTIGG